MKAIGAITLGICAVVAVACGSAATDEKSGSSTASLSTECDGDAGAPDAGPVSPFACGNGVGCVAVQQIDNCCTSGMKIAVAADQVAAYEEENACSLEKKIHTPCPLLVIDDTRVAACNPSTNTCEMVAPDAGPDDDGGMAPPLPIRF